jgi:PAS domain S-box-containing protein
MPGDRGARSSGRRKGQPALRGVAETAETSALLQGAVEEVARLLRTDGAMLYLVDSEKGDLRFAHEAGVRDRRHRDWLRELRLPVGAGLFGKAVADGRPVRTGHYERDRTFVHAGAPDRFVRDIGLRSMVVAPLISNGASYGGLGAFSSQADAFDEADTALVRALADHAAASIANMQLIERLETSERELAHRADIERALREIGERLAAISGSSDLLQLVVDETARLLGADGARIELFDAATGRLHWAYDSATGRKPGMGPIDEDLPRATGGTRDEGVSGRAFKRNVTVRTGDYLADRRFKHLPGADAQVRQHGIRSALAVPLPGEAGPLGTLTVYTSDPDAYDDDDAGVVTALGAAAGVALGNARRMEAIERSREENARRADSERTLREIAKRISAIMEPSSVLERILAEAVRLVAADGGQLDLTMPVGGLRQWVLPKENEPAGSPVQLDPPYTGISGRAIAEGRGVMTGEYLKDRSFRHTRELDRLVSGLGIRSVIAAPLLAGDALIGCLQVGSTRLHAFDDEHLGLIEALAAHAAIAIANADRLDALARSREENARLADSERALREIAARITAIRDPSDVLDQIVGEAARLLSAERAQIDLLTPIDERLSWPYPESVGDEDATAAGIATPRTGQIRGIAGRAMHEGRVMATGDYLPDRSFRHSSATDAHVRRYGLRSVVAAPLVSDGGSMGVLQLATIRPDAFGERELVLVEALATQASIAIANSRRTAELARSQADLARRAASEHGLRELAARLTAMRDPAEVLQGTVDEAIRVLDADAALLDLLESDSLLLRGAYDSGLTALLDDRTLRAQTITAGEGLSGRAIAQRKALRTTDYLTDPTFTHTRMSDRFVRRAKLRSMIAAPLLSDDGAFGTLEVFSRRPDAFDDEHVATAAALANQAAIAITNARLILELDGSRRDLEILLERVRDSESRYRLVIENSPDIVFSLAPDGRISYISESVERIGGWTPAEVIGRLFSDFVPPDEVPLATRLFVEQSADPSAPLTAEIGLLARDGQRVPIELNSQAHVHDGRVTSFHGVAREIGERLRFERELRDQAAALAASEERARLARELHDSVTQALFSMTLVTRSLELLLDRDREAALARLDDLRSLQRDALAEMRALVFELRPDGLTRDGLVHALRTHAAAVTGRMDLPVTIDAPTASRMPAPVEEALYRIAQESIHNIVKHAAAREARIVIEVTDDACRMSVSDDGRGFDPTAVPPGHLGLAGMTTRAERLGGSLSIDSRPGSGTRILVEIPLAKGTRASTAGEPAAVAAARG